MPDVRRHTSLLITLGLVAMMAAAQVGRAQDRPAKDARREGMPAEAGPVTSRWRPLLDQLVSEAVSVPEEGDKSYALADVADAFWGLDGGRSKELFKSALTAALSDEAKGGAGSASDYVISVAAKRDAQLAAQLMKQLAAQRLKEERTNTELVGAAAGLLDSDPKKAAQLIEAGARMGPTMDAAWLIFQLAERDAGAAERLYATYLARFPTSPRPDLDHLLWLAGYPFGYGEAHGGAKDPSLFRGFAGLRLKGVEPRPALAAAFLNLAAETVQGTIWQASAAAGADKDVLASLALFSTSYLGPEVARYQPEAVQRWSVLHEQAEQLTPAARRQMVAQQVRSILDVRARVTNHKSSEDYVKARAQSALDDAEKVVGTCQRDRMYAEAALGIAHTRDFTRALEVAERIKGGPLGESVRQFIYYSLAESALGKGDLVRGREYADRVAAPEQRALLYVEVAKAALRKKRQAQAAQVLREVRTLADKITEADARVGTLLAAASVFVTFDPTEASVVLREAIAAMNRSGKRDVENYSVPRKVSLACAAGEDSWYGGFATGRFSLFETLASLARSDVDGSLSVAESIGDQPTRIRALASVVKVSLLGRGAAAGHAPKVVP